MARLAFLTSGVLVAPWDDPAVSGFVDRIEGAFAAAEAHPGFIGRAGDWGEQATPACLTPEQTERVAQTLSLWVDLESVYAFAYSGAHAEALRGRKLWIEEADFPTFVAWWVPDDHTPTWMEAMDRQAHLYAYGPTPTAFPFKNAFGPDGAPLTLDHTRVKSLLS